MNLTLALRSGVGSEEKNLFGWNLIGRIFGDQPSLCWTCTTKNIFFCDLQGFSSLGRYFSDQSCSDLVVKTRFSLIWRGIYTIGFMGLVYLQYTPRFMVKSQPSVGKCRLLAGSYGITTSKHSRCRECRLESNFSLKWLLATWLAVLKWTSHWCTKELHLSRIT